MNVATILWLFLYVFLLDFEVFELKGELIDGDNVLSCVVLKGSSQEGLREEES
jgi:hypothetical protein